MTTGIAGEMEKGIIPGLKEKEIAVQVTDVEAKAEVLSAGKGVEHTRFHLQE